jgi:lipid-binding SYLF domain-containing protein
MRGRKTLLNGLWTRRRRLVCAVITGLALVGATQVRAQTVETSPDKRLQNALLSFREVMHEPDKSIPRDLLEKARCIVIFRV